MKRLSLTLIIATLATGSALAGGSHPHGGHHHGGASFGHPGSADDVTRTVAVRAADSMSLDHEPLTIRAGETVRFVVTNTGRIRHEFSLGDEAHQRAHAEMMRQMPGMVHGAEGNAVTVEPGETQEIIWTFDRPASGEVVAACQIPGHYEAGMVSRIPVQQ